MYQVIDIKTKLVVRQFAEDKARAARQYAHKLDAKYGAVRYVVRFVDVAKNDRQNQGKKEK